jgi:hypothetical protein
MCCTSKEMTFEMTQELKIKKIKRARIVSRLTRMAMKFENITEPESTMMIDSYFVRSVLLVGLAVMQCGFFGELRLFAQVAMTSMQFLDQAASVLPIEDRYDYHKSFLSGSVHSYCRNEKAICQNDELEVAATGWKILISASAGPLARMAAEDTVEYLAIGMRVQAELKVVESWKDSDKVDNSIVVGTRDDLAMKTTTGASIGSELKASKDYELCVIDRRIVVCGFDDAGVMHGLFNLQARMKLREGPFIPRNLRTVRHSLYKTRMALSWLGWMQWPDKYLSHLAHDGYDAIYASVYANPNGVEGPPHYDLIRQQDAGRLNDLIQRASKYGIRVYAAVMYANTGEEENQAKLREHVRDIVQKFPGLRGYVLLTEGFYYKKFFSGSGKGEIDLQDWSKKWTEAVGIVTEECHRIDSTIEVLPWEYNIDFRPERVELKRGIIRLLPAETIPLITWENGKQFELDGLKGYLRDYSISQIGPAEVAVGQIEEAKRRGMQIYCKADCYATWQFGTMPYLPCLQQWQRRYHALAKHGVDGTLETWSNGYKPNLVAELRCWSSWSDSFDDDTLLKQTARRIFGDGNESDAIQAWQHFSQAIQWVPDTGPSMGTNNAVAQPLFFREPPPRIMTLHNSWWDEAKKTPWRHRMEEAWPYCHRMMVFMPDFTNRKDQAEIYARNRSGISLLGSSPLDQTTSVLPTFQKYLLKAADEMEVGLQQYRKAASAASKEKLPAACKEVLIAEQMQRMLRSLHAILEFETQRLRLHANSDRRDANAILDRMSTILVEEIARTEASYRTAQLDSRLGYECEMDYVYSPLVIEEKLQVLHKTLEIEIPAHRKSLSE